jgi:ABC-type multidrug transport system fused ATPase/permease subunit
MYPGSEKNKSLLNIIKDIISVFYTAKKFKFLLLLFMILLASLVDVLSLSMIIPVVYLINDPTPIDNNSLLHFLYVQFHFTAHDYFILFLLVCLVIVFLLKNLFMVSVVHIQNKFIYSTVYDLIDKQLNLFFKSEYLNIKSSNSVNYLRALVLAPQEFSGNLLLPLLLMLNEVFVVCLIATALLMYSPVLVLLLSVTILPVTFFFLKIAKNKLLEISDIKDTLENKISVKTLESIHAYTDIKLFSKEQVFIKSIKDNIEKWFSINADTNFYNWIPRRIIETIVILTICLLFLFALLLSGDYYKDIVLVLLAFAAAAYRLLPSLNEIIINMIRIKSSSYILDQLLFIKDNIVSVNSQLDGFTSKIEFKDLCFKYKDNNNELLSDLTATFNKGEFVVITGESGSGKSTLGKILTGFVKPDSGHYLIDNTEIQHFDQIKNLFGYVTQDFFLLDDTLLNNIAIGEHQEEICMEKINDVIVASNLSELISTLPFGIHQPIGEMGNKLSGGQKQRIAIARALYKESKILVLDEITSALDTDNERNILDIIYKLSKQKNISVFIFTHRLSSLQNFDRVYELKNGKLIQQ